MARSCSQLCYKALVLTSKLVVLIACASVTLTAIASCFMDNGQLDSLANIIWRMTKILLYMCITVGSFLLGAASKRIQQDQEQQHAAVLQAATRRKLSQRSTTTQPTQPSPPTTPPVTLRLDTNCDSPPKRRSSRRTRGKASRLEFDSPTAPIPMERRASMGDADLQW